MKIEILTTVSGENYFYKKGEVVEVQNAIALDLLNAKHAKAVEKKPVTKRTTRKKTTKK